MTEVASDPAPDAALVTLDIAAGVAWLRLDNPRRRNSITLPMAAQLVELCDRIDADPSVGAVVVQGDESYFCSGADRALLALVAADPTSDESVAGLSAVYEAFVRFGALKPASVAVVQGGAVGAGMNLALAADLLVVADDATLESGFLARGLHPGGGNIGLVAAKAGNQAALALTVFGGSMSGAEAALRGLAWASAPADELEELVTELVAPPAADPELARRIKASARLELGPPAVPWPAALEVERGAQMWSLARRQR